MSNSTARVFAYVTLFVAVVAGMASGAFAQATPLAPNSIQVSRVNFDGANSNLGNGDSYTSPYNFPEIFNDQTGCNTGNDICNIAGIQGSIYIDQFGSVPLSAEAPNAPLALPSTGAYVGTFPTPEPGSYITTSFSSKSEGALMLSPNAAYLTYMGYQAADQLVDVSNGYSLEPSAELSPNTYTDSAGNAYPFYDREVALIGADGSVNLTPIDNADSGDNPRAAITADGNELYTAGNSDSTCSSYPCNPANAPTVPNNPGLTIGVRCAIPGNSQSYQLGTYVATDRTDESNKKHVKDNNWRGIGIYTDGNGNQQLYVSKGSGGNGDDGIFQVGSPLPACTLNGTNTTNTITELLGAQATVPNGQSYQTSPYLPFGFWMADPTTLYVADEGNPPSYTSGPPSYTASPTSFQNSTNGVFTLPQLANGSYASDPYAGLEKWSLVNGTWQYDYTIQAGLNLYQPQTFARYTDVNGSLIQSYTYGLRNMSGFNNGDGTATIYAITSQFSAVSGGEPDPTSLVGITDQISATSLPANEQFVTLQTSANQEVFRGVAYVPPAAGFSRQTQTITFSSPSTVTYGAAPITLAATATSGWPISYSLTSGPATLAGNVLTITGVGTVVVQATQSGNTDYLSASTAQSITVNPAPLTVTANNASSTYGGGLPAFSALITGFVNGDSSSVVSGAPSLTTNATATSGVGSYSITPGVGSLSAANYTFSIFVNGTLTINPALLLVTPNNATTTYGTIPTFTAGITGFVNGDNSSVVSGSPALTTTATSTSPVGTYPITASPGSLFAANYTFTFGMGVLTINQASQTISFSMAAPATAPYGSMFTVVANASSLLAVSYGSSGSCSNASGVYTITSSSGTCTVTVSQAGNTNYLAAPTVMEVTSATRANPTVSFTGAPVTAPYLSTFQLLATTNASGVAYITSTDPSTCSLSGPYSPVTVTILRDAGICKFTAAWGADANYNPATASQTTTGVKAASSVTWATPAAITYGTPLGPDQLDAMSSLPGNYIYSPTTGKILDIGTTALSVTFKPTNTNYTSSTASVSLEVLKAPTMTTITSPSATVSLSRLGVANVEMTFSVTSYRPTGEVAVTATTGEQCSSSVNAVTGAGLCRLTFETTGTRTITAKYIGDVNHLGSNSSGQTPPITVTVNPY